MPAAGSHRWVLWGSELSPFALKVELLLRLAELPFVWMPAAGPPRAARRYARRRERLIRRRLPLTWPEMTALDEFPQVPFLFGPADENLYDSSAIGDWLAHHAREAGPRARALLPADDPALRFAVRLVDEALDEVGLYLVHHNRWVLAAADNDAGARLAREMRPLLGPFAALLGWGFPRRQVRRLPYLFSVAATDAPHAFAHLPRGRRPPGRAGFPPTHPLLDELFARLLAALEPIFARRPFLFGDRPTLADASVYGQLDMNRADPSAWRLIAARAPATAAWIERLARGEIGDGAAPLALHPDLAPLFGWIAAGFVPLMQQNAAAWERHRQAGETRFNERAFDAGRALYDGTLLGHPFRNVAKTFQVKVWQALRDDWRALSDGDRGRLAALMPVDGFA